MINLSIGMLAQSRFANVNLWESSQINIVNHVLKIFFKSITRTGRERNLSIKCLMNIETEVDKLSVCCVCGDIGKSVTDLFLAIQIYPTKLNIELP